MDQNVKEAVDKQRRVANKILEGGELAAATTYSYSCQVSVAGLGANFLNVDFKNGVSFSGGFGPGVGGYICADTRNPSPSVPPELHKIDNWNSARVRSLFLSGLADLAARVSR